MINRLVKLVKLINLNCNLEIENNKEENKEENINFKYDLIKNKDFHLLFIGLCSN